MYLFASYFTITLNSFTTLTLQMRNGFNIPLQGHISLTDKHDEMRVMWITNSNTHTPTVMYGISPGNYSHKALGGCMYVMYACVYVCMYVCMNVYVCMYVCMYVMYMYVYMYVCMYVMLIVLSLHTHTTYTHTHTHTHTNTGSTHTYSIASMCGPPANITLQMYGRDPGMIHNVLLIALSPVTRYYYRYDVYVCVCVCMCMCMLCICVDMCICMCMYVYVMYMCMCRYVYMCVCMYVYAYVFTVYVYECVYVGIRTVCM